MRQDKQNKQSGPYTVVEMTHPEMVDFTGFEKRMATPEEIDIIAGDAVLSMMDGNKIKGRVVKGSEYGEEINKEIAILTPELAATSFILEFKSVGKRIFVWHQIKMVNVDHLAAIPAEIRQMVTPALESKNATPHHHVVFCAHYLLINFDNSIEHLFSKEEDVCLSETSEHKH
jgi:hypothetical protein